MALEHRCVSIGDPFTYTLILIATCARTSARAHTSAAPPSTTAAHASTTGPAQSTAVHAGPEAAHTKDKPVTEAVFHAPMFALKADADWNTCEPRTRRSAAAGSARTRQEVLARVGADAGAPTHTHERAPACTNDARLGAYVAHVRLGDTRVRRSAHGAGCVGMECIPIPTHRCVSAHGCEERAPYSHTRSATPYRQPAHTGTLVCMGEAPTYPRACVAQELYLQMVPCIDLSISDTSAASETHTYTNTRAQQLGPARARAHAAAGVSTADPHIRREIFTSLRSHLTLSPEC
jgi:hypothetical protein